MSVNLQHDDYTIVWFAILDIEVEAAIAALTKLHDGGFESTQQDDYIYFAGEIENHNVVIAKLPEGEQTGNVSSASIVNHVKVRFTNIWFALLVGVAAGLPHYDLTSPQARDIRLGDVLVCVPSRHSQGVLHFDIGADTEEGFEVQSRQTEPPKLVLSAISTMRMIIKRPYKHGNKLAQMLRELQEKYDLDADANERRKFAYPGQHKDEFYQRIPDADTQQQDKKLKRPLRDSNEVTRVWYGSIGSSNALIRNAKKRDYLRDKYDLIGLEMEAAGLMNTVRTGVIRGVCDYADSHKSDDWQPYAAAVAAVYAKALLGQIRVAKKDNDQISDSVFLVLDQLRTQSKFLKCSAHRYHHFMTQEGMLMYSRLWNMISRGRDHISFDEFTGCVKHTNVSADFLSESWSRLGDKNEPFGQAKIMAIFYMIHLECLNKSDLKTPDAARFTSNTDMNENFLLMDKWVPCQDKCGLEWNFTASSYGFCRTKNVGTLRTDQNKCLMYRRYLEKKDQGQDSETGKEYESRLNRQEKDKAEKMREACKRQWRPR